MSEESMGTQRHPGPRRGERLRNGRSPKPHIRGYVHENGRVLEPFGRYAWVDQRGGVISPADTPVSEVDSYLRGRGFRPVFSPRDFHARALAGGGFVLHCRRCDTREEFSNRERAHDLASHHARWFHAGPVRVPAYQEIMGRVRAQKSEPWPQL